jgi:hypothetical protein
VRNIGRLGLASLPLALVAVLAACNGKGIQTPPQDINVSPRSQSAYDPVYQELEDDPLDEENRRQQ